ncbi:replication protein [Noviherbaspirillum suwonense]|uniref:Phage replication protein O n=1 Tax=Noviherbaspirillum suwonense TaxID=1224511 RepID=A0ABY1QK08_9BURK|nr:replication protein [Noviherbaspirillum suwonense]SMP71836.1 phage replication protein O [Noviherbaspirillum suwonense]
MSANVHRIADHQPRSPQVENGYIRVANELNQAICRAHLSGNEMAVAFAIVAKTYGYNKKTDDMSASQIGEYCDIARNHVTEVLKSLEARNIITKRPGRYGSIIGIQKDYSLWLPKEKRKEKQVEQAASPSYGLGEEVVRNSDSDSPKLGQVDSPKDGHTKDNLPKDNQQKTKRASRRGKENCFDSWIAETKEQGIKPIPEDHSVFTYAEKIALPIDYVRLCWLEFKTEHAGNTEKTQRDWPKAFSNYVRKNYYRLWFGKDGGWSLTTRGIQLEKEMRGQ